MSTDETHVLTVADLERLTPDAVAITLAVPPGSREAFRYEPGQFLMVRFTDADGVTDYRSYSLCQAPPADGSAPERVRVAVRLLGPGGFGEYAHTKLACGDPLTVLRPGGRFRLRPAERHVAVAAGSGITPVLAMAEAALARGDRFTLLYGNRTPDSTMFAARLAALERAHAPRLTMLRVTSRSDQGDPLLHGRIDADRLPRLLEAAGVDVADPGTQYYLCGPMAMVATAHAFLTGAGVERRRVSRELFSAGVVPVERPA